MEPGPNEAFGQAIKFVCFLSLLSTHAHIASSPLTPFPCVAVEDYAEGLRHFIASGALAGHKLITIGHSLGATAMCVCVYSCSQQYSLYTG